MQKNTLHVKSIRIVHLQVLHFFFSPSLLLFSFQIFCSLKKWRSKQMVDFLRARDALLMKCCHS